MKLSCVLIEEENRADFDSVFPDMIELVPERVAVAAVDEEDRVLASISYRVINFEYVIDWIFVEPDFRRQGIGSYLINQVLSAVMQSGSIMPVTARFEFKEDGEALHTFFLSCQAMNTSYSHERYYVTPDEIKSSDALHRPVKAQHKVVPFFDQSVNEQKAILNMLSRQQAYTVLNYEKWKQECIPELCQCVFVNNNLVDLIFMRKLHDGNLDLSYLYGKYPRGLIELLGSIVRKMEALFPEASLVFDAMSDESMQLAKHLFPKSRTTHIFEAEF